MPNLKNIPLVWPIIVTALSLLVTAASANTRLNDLTDRVNYIWENGSPPVATTLARIDERQTLMSKQLDRMEQKLDDIDTGNKSGR